MSLSDSEIADVEMIGALKRVHPSTDDDGGQFHLLKKSPRETKKSKSKANQGESAKVSTKSVVERESPKRSAVAAAAQGMDNESAKRDRAGPSTEVTRDKSKYDAYGRAPFIVMARMRSDNEMHKKRISLVKISNILHKCNVKFNQVEKYSRDTWKMSFASKSVANSTLSNKFLEEAGIVTFIPRYKLCRKIVVREIPDDLSLEEIKKVVEEENGSIMISNLFRLKRRNRSTRQLEDSEAVCLEIRGEKIPDMITMWRAVLPVSPYVQSVRLCFKCGRIGHISKFCDKPEACLNCSGDHRSSKEVPCSLEKKCINCGGPHSTMDRGCPVFVKHNEIAKVMAYENLPFLEARTSVEKRIGPANPPPFRSPGDFPHLVGTNPSGRVSMRQQPNFQGEAMSYRAAMDSGYNDSFKKVVTGITEMRLSDKEAEELFKHIFKVLEVFKITLSNKRDISNGANN
ncbi:Nucleic-acid-binding protein from mobile element jockey [Cyphomyrmex costatus]|uniref:Nucleic-acid-binding protein from mobile element jockey n=1 Tax=Cyphomyrmex costatus TaxID=456900 RepID=A0A151I7D9_9HYME|nr:Nucleic-acid-binding protein from mobile element jockey [Cyphomyrmex costatus]